jgi:rubredoxin
MSDRNGEESKAPNILPYASGAPRRAPRAPMPDEAGEADGPERAAPRDALPYAPPMRQPELIARGGALVDAMSFSTATEAGMAQARLAAEGIPAFLDNENVVQFNWMLSAATGGVRVTVHESDLIAARAILTAPPDVAKIDYRPGAEFRDDDDESAAHNFDAADDDGYVEEDWRCPKCHRKQVDLVPLNPLWVILALPLVGLPLLFFPRQRHCRACGHVWKKTS